MDLPRLLMSTAKQEFAQLRSSKNRRVEDAHDSLIDFWSGLGARHQRGLCKVTEDLPLGARELAGMLSPYRSLTRGSACRRAADALVKFAKLLLNLACAAIPVYHLFWEAPDALRSYHSHSHMSLANGTLTVCYNGTSFCAQHVRPHALLAKQIVACLELAVIGSATVAFLLFTLVFLMKSRTARARFLLQMPFVLVLLPTLAGSFSLLKGLLFLNLSFAYRTFRRGDLPLYATLLTTNICPKSLSWLHKVYDRSRCMVCAEVLVSICFVLAGLVALRSKFLFMYFASTVSVSQWDLRSVVLFMGFVNQIASIFDHTYFEFSRMLIMKFGGKDSVWSAEEMRTVPDFFGLLFSRFVLGRISTTCCPGIRTLAVLLTFNPDKFQHLLLSDKRHLAMQKVRDDRHRLIGEMLRPELAGLPIERRAEAVQRCMNDWQAFIQAETARCSAKVGLDGHRWDMEYMELAERTRLLALIQSHMADMYAETVDDVEGDRCIEEEEEDGETSCCSDDSCSHVHSQPAVVAAPGDLKNAFLGLLV